MSTNVWAVQTVIGFDKARPSAQKRIYERGDRAGFYIQQTPAGAMTPGIQYRHNGKRQLLRLGAKIDLSKIPAKAQKARVGEWLKAAREAADAALDLLDQGIDPKVQAQEDAAKAVAAEAVARGLGTAVELFECYLTAYEEGRSNKKQSGAGKHPAKLRGRYERDIKPVLGEVLKANEITNDHVNTIMQRPIARCKGTDKTGHESARDLRALCNAAITYGLTFDDDPIDQELHQGLKFDIPYNPVKPQRKGLTGKARTRYLNADEVCKAWKAWDNFDDKLNGLCLKLILLTGQRVNEIAGLRWDEIDDELIALPPERTKNGNVHAIPITPMMQQILDDAAYYFGDDTYVFPVNGKHGARALEDKRVLLGVNATEGVAHFQTRDLRRTWKTHLGRLGFSLEHRDICQNHTLAGTGARHYDQYTYLDEKREVFGAWDDELQRMLDEESNVVRLAS